MQFETRKWVLLWGARSAVGVFRTDYGGLRFLNAKLDLITGWDVGGGAGWVLSTLHEEQESLCPSFFASFAQVNSG